MKQKKSEEIKLDLKGKKVLITQPIICNIIGSMVVTLELAEYLISVGANVVVYTCSYANPAKKFFEDKKINVVTADEEPDFHIADFDYIWVNSQILPISMVGDLGKTQKSRMLYCHMSGAEWIPDERPWIFELEEKTASLSLYISEGAKSINEGYMSQETPFAYFRNPAPTEYGVIERRRNEKRPRNILIVSNHPPEEVLMAKEDLEKQGITVNLLSEINKEKRLISPKHLEKADVVVTIGKTVQYCLVSGIPVYVYDHFGGCGYLNDANINKAKERNFSGREAGKKSKEEISKEILEEYDKALAFCSGNREKFKKEYLISEVIPDILNKAKERTIEPFESRQVKTIELSQRIAIDNFRAVTREKTLDDTYKKIIEQYDKKVKELVAQYDSIIASKTWKVGALVLRPFGFLRSILRKTK